MVSFDRPRLTETLRAILGDHGRSDGLLSVAVVDDSTIHGINRQFLDHDEPTDVISFPLEDDGDVDALDDDDPFAELVVSAETAVREAAARGIAPERELALYAIHGTLHLVGYDDHAPEDLRVMRQRETDYLSRLEGGGIDSHSG